MTTPTGPRSMLRCGLPIALLAIAGCAGAPIGAQLGPAILPAIVVPAIAASAPLPPLPAREVSIRIDDAVSYQVMEGFGATTTEWFDPATGEDLMGALRPRVIEAVYGQIGITMGHLDVSPFENFDPVTRATANDDDDPNTFNWSAFNFVRSNGHKRGIVDLAQPFGFDNFTIHGGTNARWADPWLADLRRSSYRRYLDEMAENVLAPLVYWRDKFGIVTRWHHLFNEPISGNGELGGGGIQEVVDLVKTVGMRMRREGFAMKLVVASEESEESSLDAARAILADPQARSYVGAISYHTYPYGSVYSQVSRILETSGQGRPDPGRIKVRNELRDLAARYGMQVWMTEVSNGRAGYLDTLRGRAIHIHDELQYANASSYWAMFEAWDSLAPRGGSCDEDCLVYFNRVRETVSIGGIGRAIGHYARWVKRGAIRVEAASDDALVLVSAFRDDSRKRLVAVIINNHSDPVAVTIHGAGRSDFAGTIEGEQSSAAGDWLPLLPAPRQAAGNDTVVLPGRSVTTVSTTRH